MRISDWSSDVCSSDLRELRRPPSGGGPPGPDAADGARRAARLGRRRRRRPRAARAPRPAHRCRRPRVGEPRPDRGPMSLHLPTPAVALAIGAHPAAVEFGAGAALAKWSAHGWLAPPPLFTDNPEASPGGKKGVP